MQTRRKTVKKVQLKTVKGAKHAAGAGGHVIIGLDDNFEPVFQKKRFKFDETWIAPEPEIKSGIGDELSLVIVKSEQEAVFAVLSTSVIAGHEFWIATLDGETLLEQSELAGKGRGMEWQPCRIAPPEVVTAYMSWRTIV